MTYFNDLAPSGRKINLFPVKDGTKAGHMKFLKRIAFLLFVGLLCASCYVGPPGYAAPQYSYPGPYYPYSDPYPYYAYPAPYYAGPSPGFYFGGGHGGHDGGNRGWHGRH
jgi:hypothetical protein